MVQAYVWVELLPAPSVPFTMRLWLPSVRPVRERVEPVLTHVVPPSVEYW